MDLFFWKRRPEPLREFVAIRMEAIGGQGANSAGKILAEAAVLGMGYSGQHFSSYGSEKRGSPVKSFVRFHRDANQPIRSSSPVTNPDLLVVFHESLIAHNPEILDGANDTTLLLINSPLLPSHVALPEGVHAGRIATVDASAVAERLKCGLNSVLLGAIGKLCPEVATEKIEAALLKFFHKLDDPRREAIRRGFHDGQKGLQVRAFREHQAKTPRPEAKIPRLGWINAPIGGAILNPGNTVVRDLSASRSGQIPLLNMESCIHCGRCDMVCPDYCFVWDHKSEHQVARLVGIDYQFCKGCGKCIQACPMGALVQTADSDDLANRNRVIKYAPKTES